MSTDGLSATDEWLRWKRANEVVRLAVVGDVSVAAGVSEPELTVLVQLNDAGGTLRQNAIVASTGWDRTRLSHLLTRMEARGYLGRERIRNGVEVTLQPAGRALIDAAQPRLEAAVRRHLLDRLTDEDRRALHQIIDRLLA